MSTYFKEDEQDLNNNNNDIFKPFRKALILYQAINDKVLYYRHERWIAVGLIAFLYILRIYITQGYHAVTYCLGIHLLNSFIGFISPLDDPEDEQVEMGNSDSFLPQR